MIDDMDMGDTLDEWSQTIKLKTLVDATVRFQPVKAVTVADILAVVQPPRPEVIAKLNLDLTARYFTLHTRTPVVTGQFFEYKGADYRIVELTDWSDYGYYEAIGQDTKEALLLPLPPEPDEGGNP